MRFFAVLINVDTLDKVVTGDASKEIADRMPAKILGLIRLETVL